MKRFIRFASVGAVGFGVDAAVLSALLVLTPLGPLLARILSIAAAMTATWLLNRRLTFGPSHRGAATEGARYGGVALSVSLANYLIYSATLLTLPMVPPVVALGFASLCAMALSYLGYSRLVFDR